MKYTESIQAFVVPCPEEWPTSLAHFCSFVGRIQSIDELFLFSGRDLAKSRLFAVPESVAQKIIKFFNCVDF